MPNQLLFSNPEADGRDSKGSLLTEGELGFVLIGRRLVPRRSARGSTVRNVDLKALGPLLTVLGGGRTGQAAFGGDYGSSPKFWKE